jgi:NAD(P)-dependent dehydrogenase (short-subunit alcohol dehydrogenase family)
MRKLDGKIALSTGGNSGIGLATAKEFVKEEAHVFITERRDPELATAVNDIGRSVKGVQGDVSNLRDLDRLFAQIATAVVFQASEDSSITGSELLLDGGIAQVQGPKPAPASSWVVEKFFHPPAIHRLGPSTSQ